MPIPDQDFSDRTAAVIRRVEGTPPRGRGRRGSRRYFSDQFYPFELTADLTAGSSANAKLLEWDIDTSAFVTTGDTVTVYDDMNAATLGGKIDDQGMFIYVEEDRRVITQITTQARHITFKINDGTGLSAGDTSISVDTVVGYEGSDPGTTATVLTPEKWEADDDAVGWAWYDGNDYRMGNVDCPA